MFDILILLFEPQASLGFLDFLLRPPRGYFSCVKTRKVRCVERKFSFIW